MYPGIHNFSEIGKLNKVLLHRPGEELESLTPATLERLLFDDIPYLKVAQEEHDRFAEVLRENGVDAMFDIYNETLGVSVITVVLPVWYQGMSKEERKKPLNKLKLSVLIRATSILLGFGFKDIQIAYIGPGYEKYEGKTVHEIAKENGKSDLDMYLQLCEESDFKGRVNMGPYSTPEIIREFEHNPNCLYMTDAWVEDFGVQNPAIYDCYPKFLRDSVANLGITIARKPFKFRVYGAVDICTLKVV